MPVSQEVVSQYAPVVYFHPNERFFPCSIDYLLQNAVLRDRNQPDWSTPNPTQATLAQFSTPNYYVAIAPSQSGGMGIRAPMYYAVQEYDDAVEITYAMLYAEHGGQTCRALRLLSEFDCIVETLGMHQGDLERVVVTLIPQPGGQYRVLRVGYESHGDMTYFPTHSIAWEGTHPVVNSALNGHSSHSIKAQGDRIVDFEVPLIVSIVSALGAGLAWRPFDSGGLLQLGLDASGKPIGSQVWAAFAGRLGDQQTNQLDGATYFDGSNLSGADWAFVKLTDWVARLLGKYPENILEGNGPTGPGDRAWIKPASGKLLGDALTVLTATSDVGQGPGAVAWLSARR